MSRWTLEFLDQVKGIAEAAGHVILNIYQQDDIEIQTKLDHSPLTQADLAAHEIITKALHALTPDIPILSEEGETLTGEVDTFWCVDPLDGTKEFIARNGEFTVNIALVIEGKSVLGVIYAPVLNTLYYAAEGIGAFKQLANQDAETINVRQLQERG